MTWGNPPKLEPVKPVKGKPVTPEQLAGDSEHSQQVALFAWAALNVGKYPQLKFMFAIPNGGLRDVRIATNLKAEGVKAGVPDIFLPWPVRMQWAAICPNDAYHGCFIEMKWKKNKTTNEQIEFMEYATLAGYYCKVCYSWEEARDTLIAYLEGRL